MSSYHGSGSWISLNKVLCFLLVLNIYSLNSFCQDVRPLSFYIDAASKNNPALKENSNRQSLNAIQKKFITAEIKTPKVSLTGDYLFAPFFSSHNKAIEITNNPSSKAIGYDAGITNGGLYSALLNVNVPVFTNKATAPLFLQNKIQLDQLSNEQLILKHELEKNVTDLYVAGLQLQQQMQNTKELSDLLDERLNIAKQLSEKGLMPAGDVLLLQIEKGNRNNDLLDLEIKYKANLIQLNNACGIADTSTIQMEAPVMEISSRKTTFNYLEKYKADSLNNALQQQVFNVKYLPQLSVFGNTGLNASYAPDIPRNIGLSAGVHLAIPIYDGRQKNLNSSIVQINQRILADKKANIALQLNNNLDLLESQISQKQKVISLQNQLLKQYQTLLNVYRQRAANGQLSAIDFVNTLSQYKTAQQTIAQLQSDLLLLISEYNYLNW